MNIEENRLQTFAGWPSDSPVTPERIAKAGFYSVNQGLTVECFTCLLRISEWNFGDQVMARHEAKSPFCRFILNPNTSGNVPRISPTNVPSSPSCSTSNCLTFEHVRLASFVNWPIPEIVAPERLARAGLYYIREGDNTKCAYCNGVLRSWVLGDDPDREHQRLFPNCPFVKSSIIPRINSTTESDAPTPVRKDSFPNFNIVNLDELGVQTHKGPKRSDFATVESRARTFACWPVDLIQTPDVLSQAGFYYEGMGDQVRCFHCDGGLRHWDPQDDPWTEHARWFPNCSFVKSVKGQEFVTACSLEHNEGSNLEEVCEKPPAAPRRREVTERELQEHMTSPIALAALSIGLNVERVKRAIKEKLEQTGRAYSQPDALVEAALNLQHDEEDISSGGESSQLGNQVGNAIASVPRWMENSGECQGKSDVVMAPSEISDVPKLSKGVSLEEENRILKEARLCKICMDSEVGIVFLPCGHLATCVICAPNLAACPVCRSSIKATVRTFLS